MGTLKRFVLVLVLCGLALAYLYQHNWSMRLTRRVAELAKQRQSLVEEREQIDVELDRLASFTRMDSLWQPQTRPVADHVQAGDGRDTARPTLVDGQTVAKGSSVSNHGQQLDKVDSVLAGGR